MGSEWRTGVCPTCGGPSEVRDLRDGSEWHWCTPCERRKEAAQQAFVDEIKRALRRSGPLAERCGKTLMRRFMKKGGMDALRAASDADLLAAPMFGPRMLALVRTHLPAGPGLAQPVASPVVARADWREHAEMVAGVSP